MVPKTQAGERPLPERARWLRHATCLIGLSSGLAWLAWAARAPVVMISGSTHPMNEFHTPYRVINFHACNSCSNKFRHPPDRRRASQDRHRQHPWLRPHGAGAWTR